MDTTFNSSRTTICDSNQDLSSDVVSKQNNCLTPALRIETVNDSPRKKQKVVNTQWDHKHLCHFTFTPYRVVGKGNFGMVQHGLWHVCFPKHPRRIIQHEVAIKTVVKQTDMHLQLKKEIEVLTRLRHLPFYTKLYAIAQDRRQVHLVLNYCANGDLFSHIQRQIMRERGLCDHVFYAQMMRFACEIVVAVAYLHEQHILHADIKCENILITENGHIQLCDFGLSDVNVTSNSVYGKKGSELYTSPEQLLGMMYGLSVDVWALGYVFLFMFSNIVPRAHKYGDTTNVNIDALDNDSFTPPLMKALIKQLLTVDRRMRPTMAEVKTHEVFQHVDWEAVSDHTNWTFPIPPVTSDVNLSTKVNARTTEVDAIDANITGPDDHTKSDAPGNDVLSFALQSQPSLALQTPLCVGVEIENKIELQDNDDIIHTTSTETLTGYSDGVFEDVFTRLATLPILYEECTSVTFVMVYEAIGKNESTKE